MISWLKMKELYFQRRIRTKIPLTAMLPAIAVTFLILLLGFKFLKRQHSSKYDAVKSRSSLELESMKQLSDTIRHLQLQLQQSPDIVQNTRNDAKYAPGRIDSPKGNITVSCNCNATSQVSHCEVLHITIVCGGQKAVPEVVTLIKSILFYRKNPLHFHFITDEMGKLIIETMLRSWVLPGVEMTLYLAENYKSELSWIPAKKFSGLFELIQLVITEILPGDLDKTIFLDKSVKLTADIADLWRHFPKLTGKTTIGLVDIELNENKLSTFGVDSLIDTDVMLLDMKKLRDLNWMKVWKITLEKALLKLSTLPVSLTFKDVINTAIKEYPYLVHTLPCVWNFRLDERTRSKQCNTYITDPRDIKVIHWASTKMVRKANNIHFEYFNDLLLEFLEYSGNQFRRELFSCPKVIASLPPPEEVDENHRCYQFRKESSLMYRIHLYFINFDYKPRASGHDVTFVSQLSIDRIHMVEALCNHWKGPISVAIYLTEPEAPQLLTYVSNSKILRARTNIGYHVIYKHGQSYPINYLRNVALKHVTTSYVFLSDIDFLPMKGMYQYQLSALDALIGKNSKTAFIIPAFENRNITLTFPESKKDLLRMESTRQVLAFHIEHFSKGHGPTNFTKWRNATMPYKVEYQARFEPYVVVPRNCPTYDVRFVGYGGNKISHIVELVAQGYEFLVLPGAFILHMPHAPSFDSDSFRASKLYRLCLKILEKELASDIAKKYQDFVPPQ